MLLLHAGLAIWIHPLAVPSLFAIMLLIPPTVCDDASRLPLFLMGTLFFPSSKLALCNKPQEVSDSCAIVKSRTVHDRETSFCLLAKKPCAKLVLFRLRTCVFGHMCLATSH